MLLALDLAMMLMAASLLPSQPQKLAIMQQEFELTVERPASQFHWQWWQRLVK